MITSDYTALQAIVVMKADDATYLGVCWSNPKHDDGILRPMLVRLSPPKELYHGKPHRARR
jgi:hypothetical protein